MFSRSSVGDGRHRSIKKRSGETSREWGEPIRMDDAVKQRVDEIWDRLGIFDER